MRSNAQRHCNRVHVCSSKPPLRRPPRSPSHPSTDNIVNPINFVGPNSPDAYAVTAGVYNDADTLYILQIAKPVKGVKPGKIATWHGALFEGPLVI